jgi:hypothetical protein
VISKQCAFLRRKKKKPAWGGAGNIENQCGADLGNITSGYRTLNPHFHLGP